MAMTSKEIDQVRKEIADMIGESLNNICIDLHVPGFISYVNTPLGASYRSTFHSTLDGSLLELKQEVLDKTANKN